MSSLGYYTVFISELTEFKIRRIAYFKKHLVDLAELELKHSKVRNDATGNTISYLETSLDIYLNLMFNVLTLLLFFLKMQLDTSNLRKCRKCFLSFAGSSPITAELHKCIT